MVKKHPEATYVPTFLKPYQEKDPKELENLTAPLRPSDDTSVGAAIDPMDVEDPKPLFTEPQTLSFAPTNSLLMGTLPQQPVVLTTTQLPARPTAAALNPPPSRPVRRSAQKAASRIQQHSQSSLGIVTPQVASPNPFSPQPDGLVVDPSQVDIQQLLSPVRPGLAQQFGGDHQNQLLQLLQSPLPTESLLVSPTSSSSTSWLLSPSLLPGTPSVSSPSVALTSSGNFPPPIALTTTELAAATPLTPGFFGAPGSAAKSPVFSPTKSRPSRKK